MSNKFYMQTFGALEWDPDALQPGMIIDLGVGQCQQNQQDVNEDNQEVLNFQDYQDQ